MDTNRGQFNTRIGFILAAAGSAVGLGNIWKFPFEVGEGGGAAFVVIYLAFCFLLCFPVMVSEIAIGRKTNLNPVGAFKKLGHKNWAIIGFMGVLAGVLILSFYNVVAGWAFGYFLEMIQGNFGIGEEFGSFITDWQKIGLYGLVFMAITAFIVSRGIHGGIERAATILMPTLFLMIIGLIKIRRFGGAHILEGKPLALFGFLLVIQTMFDIFSPFVYYGLIISWTIHSLVNLLYLYRPNLFNESQRSLILGLFGVEIEQGLIKYLF